MNLHTIHHDILETRAALQSAALRNLRTMIPHARAVSHRYTGFEMLVLLAVYENLPNSKLRTLDVDAADPSCTEDELDGAFSQCLASFLVSLLYDVSDRRVLGLLALEEQLAGSIQVLDITAGKVRTLSREQAVALQVMLEAARAVPAALRHYDNWWHPEMMLRILENPDMDWPEYGAEVMVGD